jgi:small subunit ribosomal protein S7
MRKRKAKKRPLLPDPKFNDQLVTRFVNNLMRDGKKSTAFRIFYDALDIIEQKKYLCKIFYRDLEGWSF